MHWFKAKAPIRLKLLVAFGSLIGVMALLELISFLEAGWIEHGNEKLEQMRTIAEKYGLTMLQFACIWNLSQAPVKSVGPTFIQAAQLNPKSAPHPKRYSLKDIIRKGEPASSQGGAGPQRNFLQMIDNCSKWWNRQLVRVVDGPSILSNSKSFAIQDMGDMGGLCIAASWPDISIR